jgi:hypothetical protein
LPGRLEAVDPVPLVPELELEDKEEEDVEALLDELVVLDAAVRSLNRFCVPRIAPRLEVGPVALADELAVLVLVLGDAEVVELDELEAEEGLVVELEVELDDEDPLDDDPPPLAKCPPLRFPAS